MLIVQKYGGKALSRGGKYKIMEGPEYFERFVVIEFPTFEAAVSCFESEEYQKGLRYLNADVSERFLNIAEGVD